jgi:uncharacterized protein HemX
VDEAALQASRERWRKGTAVRATVAVVVLLLVALLVGYAIWYYAQHRTPA